MHAGGDVGEALDLLDVTLARARELLPRLDELRRRPVFWTRRRVLAHVLVDRVRELLLQVGERLDDDRRGDWRRASAVRLLMPAVLFEIHPPTPAAREVRVKSAATG